VVLMLLATLISTVNNRLRHDRAERAAIDRMQRQLDTVDETLARKDREHRAERADLEQRLDSAWQAAATARALAHAAKEHALHCEREIVRLGGAPPARPDGLTEGALP